MAQPASSQLEISSPLFVSTILISLLAGGTALADEEKNAASLQLQKNSFLLGLVFS